MDEKCRLVLVGITYNQIENEVFALILQHADSNRRIPIVIGLAEAQSIECKLQEITPPRPLTHDLFVNTMTMFGLELKEVMIHRLPNGIFAADMLVDDGTHEAHIDARSSDAIALAIRVGAPIYTTRAVLDEAGFDHDPKNAEPAPEPVAMSQKSLADLVSGMSEEKLNKLLEQYVADEDYNSAAIIKQELDLRKKR